MPFREKLRKTFSRGSSSGTSSDESSTLGDDSNESKFVMYKPGEKIPYKYRRPVDKAHKERLEAFSFDNAWRRCSFHSEYSPMGSRMPSRRNSVERQTGRRSVQPRRGDVEVLADREFGVANASHVSTLSRPDSHDSPFSVADEETPLSSSAGSDFTIGRNDTPFSLEDLTLALQRVSSEYQS